MPVGVQEDLFGQTDDAPVALSGVEAIWALVDHACSFCGGRLLQRGSGKRAQFRCSECGEVGAVYVESICCCGVRTADGRRLLRCVRNADRRPGHMAEIIVEEFKEGGK